MASERIAATTAGSLKRRISLGLTIVATVGALAAVAVAQHGDLNDPNDVHGLFDVRRVEVGGVKRPRWKVITFASWGNEAVFDSGYALVRLDTFGSSRFDYYALVRSNGFRLLGSLWRDRVDKRDYKISSVAAWRPSRTGLSVRVPLAKMKVGARRAVYGWFVETLFTSGDCRRVCIDRVPDRGRVDEPLPVPSPTVTSSPTPTPSPTPSE
jgi:hypothetical protein